MPKTEAQKRSSDKLERKNKEHVNYTTKRSVARNFIKKLARKEDLEELEELIKIRNEELK